MIIVCSQRYNWNGLAIVHYVHGDDGGGGDGDDAGDDGGADGGDGDDDLGDGQVIKIILVTIVSTLVELA